MAEPKRVKISSLFELASDDMNLKLKKAKKAIPKHNLSVGEAAEFALTEFLKEYLPKKFAVMRGFLLDSNGNISKQTDVIVADALNTPILYQNEKTSLVPCECAYAAIEVKSKITTQEINKAFSNMESIRNLESLAYQRQSKKCNLYGKKWKARPINYFIFGFDSVRLEAVRNTIHNKHLSLGSPPWKRIDAVCVLEKGMICNTLNVSKDNKNPLKKYEALPTSKTEFEVWSTRNSLLLFCTLLYRILYNGELPPIDFTHYVDAI